MLHILLGADNYSLRQRLKDLKKEWDDPESLATNTTILEPKQLKPNRLIEACSMLPFIGQKRLVIVEGLFTRFETKDTDSKTKGDNKGWQTFIDWVDKMPSSTELVLIDGKLGKTNSLLKKLTPKAAVETFPPMRGPKLEQWIRSRVASSGGSISPKAVSLITEFSGENLWIIANEIDKLVTYSSGHTIDEKAVFLLTSHTREANIFTVVDAIVDRRANVAIPLLNQLIIEGAAVPYVLFMITRQLRLMIQAKEMGNHKKTLDQIRSELRLSPNYPIERLLNQTAGYSWERLVDVYHKLLETDISIKTGKQKDRIALDLLLTELCCINNTIRSPK